MTSAGSGRRDGDRDIAREQLRRLRITHPELSIAWADSAYGGTLVTWTQEFLHLTVRVVPRAPDQVGFVVLPRRWVAERTLAWLMHARRVVRDYERLPNTPKPTSPGPPSPS